MDEYQEKELLEISRGAGAEIACDRAQRFPVRTSLRYRLNNGRDWFEGSTENISRTGVLFHTDQLLPTCTPIEMQFELALEVAEGGGTVVSCRGHIVRTVLPPATDAPATMAAQISEYQFINDWFESDA
jgi:hypothetical protein